jgi:membrane protein DedA with SNARE-associated domain
LISDTWGWYLSIFFWLYFTGIGIPPCPEEAGIIYAALITALHPETHWWISWPLTIAGIICADATLYAIGRHFGRRLFEYRWVQRIINLERRQRIEERFKGHGMKILLTARLLPPLRTGVFVTAGAIHYPFLRFLLADAVYAVFGVGVFFFASAWLIDLLRMAGHWAIYIVGFAAAIYGLYRYYRYLRKRELKTTPQPPISVLELPAGTVPVGPNGAKSPAASESEQLPPLPK